MREWLRVGLVAAIVVAGVVLARFTPVGDELRALALKLAAQAERPWAAPAYVGLYAAALAVGIPGTILTLVGGAAFPPERAVAINLCGATLGAAVAFLEARFLARDAAHRLFGQHLARLGDLGSPWTCFLAFARLRLIALVPFNGLNFAAGLTRARLVPYLAGTFVGIIPSTLAYTLLAGELTRGGEARAEAVFRVAAVLVAAGLLAILPTLLARLRRAG